MLKYSKAIDCNWYAVHTETENFSWTTAANALYSQLTFLKMFFSSCLYLTARICISVPEVSFSYFINGKQTVYMWLTQESKSTRAFLNKWLNICSKTTHFPSPLAMRIPRCGIYIISRFFFHLMLNWAVHCDSWLRMNFLLTVFSSLYQFLILLPVLPTFLKYLAVIGILVLASSIYKLCNNE